MRSGSHLFLAFAWLVAAKSAVRLAELVANLNVEPGPPPGHQFLSLFALHFHAEECAFSLSTQAQDHVWDLAEYKRVKPAHCPTGATSGGTSCERNFCGHTTLFVCARALSLA